MILSTYFQRYFPTSWRKLKMMRHHQLNLSFNHQQTKKELIICFDGSCLHGGLVDRLKGIVSAFHLAQEYGWNFYIHFNHPFLLSTYFDSTIPNLYNPELNWNPWKTSFIHAVDKDESELMYYLKKKGNQKLFVYCNQDYLITDPNHSVLWRKYFHSLFKPSTYLQGFLEKQKPVYTELAFHARFTSLLGDFKDITQEVLSKDEQLELKEKAYQLIATCMHKQEQPATVFSDSLTFLEYVTQKDNRIQVMPGTPGHTEYAKNQDAILKTFVDFYSLSLFKTIISIKSFRMYSSSFARYASFIRESAYKIEEIK